MIGKEPIKVSEEYNAILDMVETSHESLFITGRAGTGKSTLLNLLKRTTKKRAVVLAPTGIAALNVGGQTIHSFFRLPPKVIDPTSITKRKNHRLYKKLQLMIIDEISMVRADLLDVIDYFLRINREVNEPFGGVQVVFFGDLFQLPPVVASQLERKMLQENYGSPYFFSSDVVSQIELIMIELRTVYRQKEKGFVDLLDRIRTRQLDYEDLNEVNGRYNDEPMDEGVITLCSTNASVNKINGEKLRKLEGVSRIYKGKITGLFNERLAPAPMQLELKIGSQVMFVKNDQEGRFVNGTIGRVIHIESDSIKVVIYDAGEQKAIELDQMEWEILRYNLDENSTNSIKSEVIGSYKQYPLRLAWAITIHKSQGKTFDRILVDLGRGAFDHGQTYVALSRCRTLEGIRLLKPIKPQDILVDERIVEFYEMMRRL